MAAFFKSCCLSVRSWKNCWVQSQLWAAFGLEISFVGPIGHNYMGVLFCNARKSNFLLSFSQKNCQFTARKDHENETLLWSKISVVIHSPVNQRCLHFNTIRNTFFPSGLIVGNKDFNESVKMNYLNWQKENRKPQKTASLSVENLKFKLETNHNCGTAWQQSWAWLIVALGEKCQKKHKIQETRKWPKLRKDAKFIAFLVKTCLLFSKAYHSLGQKQ